MLDHLLPLEDAETTAVLERSFKRRGIEILTRTKALGIKRESSGAVVSLEGPDGGTRRSRGQGACRRWGGNRTPRISVWNPSASRPSKGFNTRAKLLPTDVPSVYAAGDVVASPLLAHVASKEAEIAVEHMAGRKTAPRADPDSLPGPYTRNPRSPASESTRSGRKRKESRIPRPFPLPRGRQGRGDRPVGRAGQDSLLADDPRNTRRVHRAERTPRNSSTSFCWQRARSSCRRT
jgi:NADPH-dependent 2,4-dienoyl-CoA reductase/sulfur reductase-like enzyme